MFADMKTSALDNLTSKLAPSPTAMQSMAPKAAPQQSEWPALAPDSPPLFRPQAPMMRTQQQTPIPGPLPNGTDQTAGGSKRKWFLAVGVIGILAAAGGGFWFYSQKKGKKRR